MITAGTGGEFVTGSGACADSGQTPHLAPVASLMSRIRPSRDTHLSFARLKENTVNVGAYKRLAAVERAFRCLKTVDLHVRPIHHRLSERVRAHVWVCTLAYYVEWHWSEKYGDFYDDGPAEIVNPRVLGELMN